MFYRKVLLGGLATGLENQRCVTARGSTPPPSSILFLKIKDVKKGVHVLRGPEIPRHVIV